MAVGNAVREIAAFAAIVAAAPLVTWWAAELVWGPLDGPPRAGWSVDHERGLLCYCAPPDEITAVEYCDEPAAGAPPYAPLTEPK